MSDMARPTGRRLVVGCGYLGRRVARLWRQAGHEVIVLTRQPDKAAALAGEGFRPLIGDLTAPPAEWRLPAVDTVLFAVGYDRASALSMEAVYVQGLANVLAAAHPATDRLIYVSSTGVYAQADAEWVNEDSPCQPIRPGGKASLAAERLLHAHPLGRRSIVLRLAGIYGPGRIPRAADLRAGAPIDAPEHGWLNLIHVDDAARVVLAAEERGQAGATYLAADDSPAVRGDYYRELARLLNAPPPRFVSPPTDSPAAARAQSNKRIDNSRMRRELAVTLHYPSFREGLAAIVAESV